MSLGRNLLFWTVHGVICATPSFIYAYFAGYRSSAAIAGMVTGVVILVIIYTWLSSKSRFTIDRSSGFLAGSIRAAAHLRAALAILSTISYGLNSTGRSTVGTFLFLIDVYPGWLAIAFSNYVLGAPEPFKSSNFIPEFFPTLVTTLVTGLFFSIIFLIIVGFVRLAYRALRRSQAKPAT